MMAYTIKEIYYTLQGEGHYVGRPAIFLRFSGCNLWNGLEDSRPNAICKFCDTDFLGTDGPGGGHYQSASELTLRVEQLWAARDRSNKFVVCTGGEPLMQLDNALIEALHANNFDVAVETNGTLAIPAGIDWITVSPKADAKLVAKQGDELKIVYPQSGSNLDDYLALEFDHYYLQPMDGDELSINTSLSVKYCLENPQWKLSVQTHKLIGIE